MNLNHRITTALVGIFILLLGTVPLGAQRRMSLPEAIGTARSQSVAALEAKHAFVSTYWAYRSYQASRLPSLVLNGNLMNFAPLAHLAAKLRGWLLPLRQHLQPPEQPRASGRPEHNLHRRKALCLFRPFPHRPVRTQQETDLVLPACHGPLRPAAFLLQPVQMGQTH